MNYRKDRLIFNAIPTVFQIANPPPAVTVKRKLVVRSEIPSKRPKHVAADANTTETTSASKLEQPQPQPTQKELKLQREVNRLRSQVYRLKQIHYKINIAQLHRQLWCVAAAAPPT